MFGFGPMEILLIVVLALIVFGPARLPEIMGQVGKAIADFRRATSDLSDEFTRTIQAELQETRAMVDDTKSTVTGVHTSINAAISGTAAPVLTTPAPAPTLTAAGPNGTNGTNGTNGAYAAQSSPPLTDTAQWSWEAAAPAPSGPSVVAPPVGEASVSMQALEVAPAGSPPALPKPVQPPAPARKPTRTDDLLPPY